MEIDTQQNLAVNIKNLRLVHRYTQTYVADKLHMSRSSYAFLEAGKRSPSIGAILDLSEIYGVSPDVILNASKTQSFNLMDYAGMNKLQLLKLVDIYNQLSPYMRGCLMERAEVLLITDAT